MSRGQQNQVFNQAQTAGANAQQQANAALGTQQADAAGLKSNYGQIFGMPMSNQEKTARRDVAGGVFDAARQNAEARAARTHNAAGLNSSEDQLARDRAKSLSATEGGIQDTEFSRKMGALQGMQGLYGIDANTLRTMMGLPADYLKTQEQAAQTPSGWDIFGPALIGAAGSVAGGFAGR